MSVKERMVRIEQERLLAEKLASEAAVEELRKKRERHDQLYREGIDQALEEQSGLFDELARKGIIAMLEEVTEQKIRFIHRREKPQEEPVQPPKPFKFKKPSEAAIREAFRRKPFTVNMPKPNLSEDGEWDNSLIIIAKSNDRRYQYDHVEKYPDVVTLKYNPSRILEISGKYITFQNYIPEDESERTERVEEALAKALLEPYETPYEPETWGNLHCSHDMRIT